MVQQFKKGVRVQKSTRGQWLCARKCAFQLLVILAGLVNSVQGYACSSDADCQYPGCDDVPCGTSSDSQCNNGVWNAECNSNAGGICSYRAYGYATCQTEPPPSPCQAGSAGPDGGPCTQCVAGKYKIATDPGVAACTKCSQDTYKSTAGNGTCTPCPSWYTSPRASTSLSACVLLTMCPAGSVGTPPECADACTHNAVATEMEKTFSWGFEPFGNLETSCNWGVAAFYYEHATYHKCKNLGGAKYLCSRQQKQ